MPILHLVQCPPDDLVATLLAQRPSCLPLDRSEVLDSDENWVRMKIDTGHCVDLPDGISRAQRAIDLEGRLLWVIRSPKHRLCFPSLLREVQDAAEEAEAAVTRRAEISAEWPQVQRVLDAVAAGRLDFPLDPGDGVSGGLSAVAIEAFLRRHDLGATTTIPAAAAHRLIGVEPLVAFGIYAGWLRAGCPFPVA